MPSDPYPRMGEQSMKWSLKALIVGRGLLPLDGTSFCRNAQHDDGLRLCFRGEGLVHADGLRCM